MNDDPRAIDLGALEEALDVLHEGIQILSRDFRYLFVNEVVARQGKKRRDELLGRTMTECYPGIERTAMFATLERCMRERTAVTIENEFTHADGTRSWFELRIHPFRDGLVVASLDISERKAMLARVEEAHRQALREVVIPTLRVHEGVLLVPIVGALDPARAADMTERLLTRAVDDCAKVVILDVAGVPTLDTAVAHELLQTIAMLRLVGASTVLTGVSSHAAKALIRLGIDLATVESTADLAAGLGVALAMAARGRART